MAALSAGGETGRIAAIRVYGQPDFSSNAPNNGGESASSLNNARALAVDTVGGVYVADTFNDRVLYYPAGNTTATRVYGASDFTSNPVNDGGASATTLDQPEGIAVDQSGNVYVSDSVNNRVLYYPAGSTMPKRVYGQPGFSSNAANNGGVSATSLDHPAGLALDAANNLYVADEFNERILFYPAGSTTATRVYGQNGSFVTAGPNAGGVSAGSFNDPHGIALDSGGDLYVADGSNNRVLYIPAGSTTAARVYGQPDFSSDTDNNGGVSARSLSSPNGVSVDAADSLYVADGDNNRVLYYPAGSTTAVRVYGQPDFSSDTDNNGGISASSLSTGGFNQLTVASDGTLYVADSDNSRVLVYPASPSPTVPPLVSGTIPWHPHHDVRLSDKLSVSVDLADGHLDLSAAGMDIPGRGPDLIMNQTWDSTLAREGVTSTVGEGWQTSLTPRIGGDRTGIVLYTDATGTTWPFTATGTSGGGGDMPPPTATPVLHINAQPFAVTGPDTAYETTPGLPWQLTASSDGYTLTNVLTSETLTFDAQGRYRADTDSYGNQNSVSYRTDGTISSEANSGGRTLSVASSNGLIADVTSPLWDASHGAQGQHAAYRYTGDVLTSIAWGAGTTDALTATFGYSGTEVTRITTPYTQTAHTWTINYDDQGRVTSIVSPPRDGDASGAPTDATVFFYDATGAQVVDGATTTSPLTTTYTIDDQGEPITVTDGLDHHTFYTYDIDHDVLSTTDAKSHTTTQAYEYVGSLGSSGIGSVGLITETVKPPIAVGAINGALTPVTITDAYDPRTYDLITHTSGLGALTIYGYDGHHNVITTTQEVLDQYLDNGGTCVTHQTCPTQITWRGNVDHYDGYGERVAAINGRGLGFVSTEERFDGPKIVPTFTPDPAREAQYTTQYAYTPAGDLQSESTPPITTTLNGKTRFGPVTTAYTYDADGNKIGETSPNGNTTTYAYDHLGRQVRTTEPAVHLWDGRMVAPTSTTQYDGEGNVVRQVNANNEVTTERYDPLGREVAETNPVSGTTLITYSATEKVAEQDPQSGPTTYSYDAAGRLTRATDPTGGTTEHSYDNVGNTTAITSGSAAGPIQVETTEYNAWNQPISDTTSGPGSPPLTTQTAYDADGNVVETAQPNGDDDTVNAYDAADELVWTTVTPNPLSLTASAEDYSYDEAGNQTGYSDFDGRLEQSTYDAADRVIESTDSYTNNTTIDTQTSFDPDGNTLSQTTITQTVGPGGTIRSTSSTMTARYNADDWTMTTTDRPAGQRALTTLYDYDALGQERHRLTLNGGAAVATTVDAAGRITAIGDGSGASATYGYNRNNLPVTATLPSGVQEAMGYDPSERLTGLTATGALSDTYGYGYDPLGRTTSVTSTVNGATKVLTVMHDASGRITSVTGSPVDAANIDYDKNGNITVITASGTTSSYAYGTIPNEVMSVTVKPLGGSTPTRTTFYGYDQDGHTTGITSTAGITRLAYDSQARLSAVSLPNGTTVAMDYNAEGMRDGYTVRKGGQVLVAEQFGYEDGVLSKAIVVSGTQSYTDTYIYDPNGNPLELQRTQDRKTSRYWYVLDGRDNVVALTSITGTVVDRYTYDVWGTPTSVSESVPQPFRYAGYWWDNALGWYWVSVRSYDPVLKRWVQPDPSGQDGIRTYVNVADDPVDIIDPSGLADVPVYIQQQIDWVRQHFREPVTQGPWAPPTGDRNLIRAYIGTEVHKEIADYYIGKHIGQKVWTNYYTVDTILKAMKMPGDPYVDINQNRKPDIANQDTGDVYEIKSVNTGESSARSDLNANLMGLNVTGAGFHPGPQSDQGVNGIVPAPDGYAVFFSPSPGIILYQVSKGGFTPQTATQPHSATAPNGWVAFGTGIVVVGWGIISWGWGLLTSPGGQPASA